MGCFLGCFGSSKDVRKRPKHPQFASNQYPNHHHTPVHPTVTTTVLANQDTIKNPVDLLVPEALVKQEEEEKLSLTSKNNQEETIQLSSGTRKKVTFDSNVKEYAHVSIDKITQESEKGGEKEVVVEYSIKPIKSSSESEGSTLSSLGSFPLNHRYQNCRERDDEDEELDCEVSDLDDDEEGEEEGYDAEYSDDDYHLRQIQEFSARPCASVESRTKSSPTCLVDDGTPEKVTETPLIFKQGARDRAGYVHSVLNPVGNTTQWKAVKMKGTPSMKEEHKENFERDLGFQQSSTKSKSKFDERMNHEVAVDASVSSWLASSLKTPPSKGTHVSWDPILLSGSSVSSKGSNSVITREKRPILGALTVEELQQFSASSSPRSRSPDERPVVGPVGLHWNDKIPVQEFKGITNTTSKY